MNIKFVYIVIVVYIDVIILLLFTLYQEIAFDVFDGNVFDGNVSDNDSITSEDAKLLLSHLSTAAPDEFQPSLESKYSLLILIIII